MVIGVYRAELAMCYVHSTLGGSGGMPPPRKILNLHLMRMLWRPPESKSGDSSCLAARITGHCWLVRNC